MIKDSKWREWLHDPHAQAHSHANWIFAEYYWASEAKCIMDRERGLFAQFESESREAHVVVFEMLDGMTFNEALCILGGECRPPSESEVTNTIKSGSEWTDIVIHAAKVHVLNVLEHELDDWIKDKSPHIFDFVEAE